MSLDDFRRREAERSAYIQAMSRQARALTFAIVKVSDRRYRVMEHQSDGGNSVGSERCIVSSWKCVTPPLDHAAALREFVRLCPAALVDWAAPAEK